MNIDYEFACQDDCLDKMVPSDLRKLICERDQAYRNIDVITAERAALAAQVSGLMKIVESNALVHISANTAEISAKAIEQAATYLSESIPDKSHESVIFKDGYAYISTRYLREHAETIRQEGK